jgi:hypothetical protein
MAGPSRVDEQRFSVSALSPARSMKTLNETAADRLVRAKYGRGQAISPARLVWRSPWPAWQLLSWAVVTIIAPPFWIIGVLLMINPHSDCPLFWPSVMGVTAVANAVAIIYANQCHHRLHFTTLAQPRVRYFGAAAFSGCVLFLLLAWATGAFQDLSAPLTSSMGDSVPTDLWAAAITVVFGVLSFAHASVLHAWLAFKDISLRPGNRGF